ncbi:MAG: hypothetical protein AB1Z67_04280 [Candidatus Limnocylindrales bacterium]
MHPVRPRLHPAPAAENAWHGEFAVAETGDLRRLHALAGIDADAWRVCGLDIRFAYGEPVGVGVFAVERRRLEAVDDDWARLAADHDDVVPVTEFMLPPVRAMEILELFPEITLVAARGMAVEGEGLELRVVDRLMPVPV